MPLCVCEIDSEDWEVWHSRGLCYIHLKQFERALEALEQANSISRHDSTFLHIGKVKTPLNVQGREFKDAVRMRETADLERSHRSERQHWEHWLRSLLPQIQD